MFGAGVSEDIGRLSADIDSGDIRSAKDIDALVRAMQRETDLLGSSSREEISKLREIVHAGMVEIAADRESLRWLEREYIDDSK